MMQVHLQTKVTLVRVNPPTGDEVEEDQEKQIVEFVKSSTKGLENFINNILLEAELLNEQAAEEDKGKAEG